MKTTAIDSLRAYARMMNTLDSSHLEPLLAEDFSYTSQMVFDEIGSKQLFLEYIRPKLQTIRRANATVYAEMGTVNAYGKQQPCVILAQNKRDNLEALVLATVESGELKRLDLCIVPKPQQAVGTGEYPS